MNTEQTIKDLVRRVEALEGLPGVKERLQAGDGPWPRSEPVPFKRGESPELVEAEKAVAEAEAAWQAANDAYMRKITENGKKRLVIVSAVEQERLQEAIARRDAEERVVKARVRRAKILRRLDIEAIEGVPFATRVLEKVGLK